MDNSEQDISFEEIKDNDHLRVQKRQLGVAAAEAEKEPPVVRSEVNNHIQGSGKGSTTEGPNSPGTSKNDKSKEVNYTKKPMFDSDLVQLDLFSPFPIEFFDSGYLQKALQRIKFAENKIKYMKPKFHTLCNTNLVK